MVSSADHWRAVALVAVLSVASAGFWLVGGGTVAGVQQPETIASCTTITEPGRYTLSADITDSRVDTCINIQSDDVVLLGRGHRIDGVGAFGTAGVIVRSNGDPPLRNVTVRNVSVTDWDDGIRYIGVTDGAVVGTTTANNRVGLSLLNARDNRLAENVARDNRLRGISLLESSANNTLVGNNASNNDLFGIHLVEAGASNNTVANNTASNNEFGIALIGAQSNTLRSNTANGNQIAGIWLSTAENNRLVRNSVSNRFYGIFLADLSSGNTITDNTAESNAVGIRLRSSDENRIVDNAVVSSSDNGILLISSDRNVVTGNTGSNNARDITLISSTGNSVGNNSVSMTHARPVFNTAARESHRTASTTGSSHRFIPTLEEPPTHFKC
ncbi:nitrous oxide reductase family maturation protein NosD [Haloferax namakaokahaiae]|uniref:Nitrous oxide reductase family maturation protein NosD n=1 Tax=Haloferax namakaokahaiae TaxID=1748331 RepID=A0ABD5ZG31_9EURY